MRVCFWLWLLMLGINSRLLAQPFTSRNLGLQQGLPEYYVSGLVQDKAGFIWVATRDGLARYDGRQFKVFRHQPFREGSLAMNAILSLEAVADTALLLHLESGAYQLFNPITERFTDLFTAHQLQQSRLKLDKVIPLSGGKKVWSRSGVRLIEFDQLTHHFRAYSFPPCLTPAKSLTLVKAACGMGNTVCTLPCRATWWPSTPA